MSNLSSFVKTIRDVMRNDAGINGDAQRILADCMDVVSKGL